MLTLGTAGVRVCHEMNEPFAGTALPRRYPTREALVG